MADGMPIDDDFEDDDDEEDIDDFEDLVDHLDFDDFNTQQENSLVIRRMHLAGIPFPIMSVS